MQNEAIRPDPQDQKTVIPSRISAWENRSLINPDKGGQVSSSTLMHDSEVFCGTMKTGPRSLGIEDPGLS